MTWTTVIVGCAALLLGLIVGYREGVREGKAVGQHKQLLQDKETLEELQHALVLAKMQIDRATMPDARWQEVLEQAFDGYAFAEAVHAVTARMPLADRALYQNAATFAAHYFLVAMEHHANAQNLDTSGLQE